MKGYDFKIMQILGDYAKFEKCSPDYYSSLYFNARTNNTICYPLSRNNNAYAMTKSPGTLSRECCHRIKIQPLVAVLIYSVEIARIQKDLTSHYI